MWRADLDVLACPGCGNRMRVVATVEDARVVEPILSQLGLPNAVRPAPAQPPHPATDRFADAPA
jgi:hypothetical protein